MKQLFDRRKPHFAVWLWICDSAVPQRPLPPHGTTLHCAAVCGLRDIVKGLAIEHPQGVDSRSFGDELGLLYLASREGHLDVGQILVGHDADAVAQEKDGLCCTWRPCMAM